MMPRINFNFASLGRVPKDDKDEAKLAADVGAKMAEHYQKLILNEQPSSDPDLSEEEKEIFDSAMQLISFMPKAQETKTVSGALKVFLSEMMEFYLENPDLFIRHLEIDEKPYEAHGYLVEMRILHDHLSESFEPIDKNFSEVLEKFGDWVRSSFSTRSKFGRGPGGPS